MISYVYIQIPHEVAQRLQTDPKNSQQLITGYDATEDKHYPTLEIDDFIVEGIHKRETGDAPDPLASALFGHELWTTEIDTGYGSPHYTAPADLPEAVAALSSVDVEKLRAFYARALAAGDGVLVTVQ